MNKTRVTLFVASLLFSLRALASDPAHIHTLKVQVTNAMASFYMYQGLDADLKYANRIDESMASAYAAASRIISGTEEEIAPDTASQLVKRWDYFNGLMATFS